MWDRYKQFSSAISVALIVLAIEVSVTTCQGKRLVVMYVSPGSMEFRLGTSAYIPGPVTAVGTTGVPVCHSYS